MGARLVEEREERRGSARTNSIHCVCWLACSCSCSCAVATSFPLLPKAPQLERGLDKELLISRQVREKPAGELNLGSALEQFELH